MGGVGGWGAHPGIGSGGTPAGESPATAELRQHLSTMQQDMAHLLQHLDEEQQGRREAQRKQELQELQSAHDKEIARLERGHKEAMERLREELKPKGEPEVAELRGEVKDLR